MKQWNRRLIFLFILLLPTQLGKHFFFDFSYLSGIRIDYLSPTIYLTDIIALILVVINLRTVVSFLKEKKVLFMLGFLFLTLFFSKLPTISLFRYIKIIELLSLFAIFRQKILPPRVAIFAFLIGALFELILTLLQLVQKHSLQGLFYFFGERNLNLSLPGIAKASLNGVEILRPYGTFSHPNSLAGFYLLLYFYLLTQPKTKSLFRYVFLFFATTLILISFSKVAIVTFVLGTAIFIFRQKLNCTICKISRIFVLSISSLIFLLVQNDPLTIEKRFFLIKNSIEIVSKHALIGVGLGSYVVAQHTIPMKFLDLLQPVHNVFLLLMSETGVVFFLSIVFLLRKDILKFATAYPYLAFVLLVTGFFDHYWLTLQQNFLLLAFIFGESNTQKK